MSTEGVSGLHAEAVQAVEEDLAAAIFGKGLSMGKGIGLTNMV